MQRVRASRRERNLHVVPGLLGGLFDGCASAQNDQIGKRDLLPARVRAIEVGLDTLQTLQHLGQFLRIVDRPILLRSKTNARPVRSAAHVGAAESRGRRPGSADQFRAGQPGCKDLGLELRHVGRADERMIDRRQGILPEQRLGRHLRTEITRTRTHVAMRELEPRLGKCEFEVLRMIVEAHRYLPVGGVEFQREVRREHHRRVPYGRIVRIGNEGRCLTVCGLPLDCAARALGFHPIEREQIVEILRRKRNRVGRPGAFQTAGDGVVALARAALVLPAETLLLYTGSGGRRPHALGGIVGSMRLAESMPAGDERDGLLVVHRHAAEGLADILRGRERIRVAVRPLGIHVDQAHLRGTERFLQYPVSRVAQIAGEKHLLGSPVDQIRLPVILAAAAKAEGLEAHRLQRDISGQDHQVSPGNLLSVLLLDRPQQAPSLVEVGVVRPAVERFEALLSTVGTAASVDRTVRARAVPGHPDEERSVVAVVRRPPILRRRQDLLDVRLDGIQIEARKLLRVIEAGAPRIRLDGMLPKRRKVQMIGPPEIVRRRRTVGAGHAGQRQRRCSNRERSD